MRSDNFIAIVNEKNEQPINKSTAMGLDLVETSAKHYHILHQGKSYQAELLSFNKASKEVHLKINGKHQAVKLEDSYDQLVKRMGLSANIVHKVSAIKAPMPGLVLSIAVEVGQTVKQGEPMLILEAMKMENVIKSPGDGTVKKIVVSKGKPVDKGEVLIEME